MATGQCVFIAPDVFDVSDEGWAVVVGPASADEENVRRAVSECPVGALTLTDGESR